MPQNHFNILAYKSLELEIHPHHIIVQLLRRSLTSLSISSTTFIFIVNESTSRSECYILIHSDDKVSQIHKWSQEALQQWNPVILAKLVLLVFFSFRSLSVTWITPLLSVVACNLKMVLFEDFSKKGKSFTHYSRTKFFGSTRLHFISSLLNVKKTVCQLEMLVCGLCYGCQWPLCMI